MALNEFLFKCSDLSSTETQKYVYYKQLWRKVVQRQTFEMDLQPLVMV